jgi:flagellar hook-length control protein FliK
MSNSISGDLTGESRLLLESMGKAEAALFVGQRLSARVIETLVTGDVLLELGHGRVTVPTNMPLQSGDRVRLEVLTAGPTPEFRIVTDKVAVPRQIATTKAEPPGVAGQPAALSPRDLPVILRSLAQMVPAGMPIAQAGQIFLQAVAAVDLPPAQQLAAADSGQMTIPFMFGEECVDVRLTWDREARQESQERSEPDDDRNGQDDRDARAISLGVFVNLNIFGGIEARMIWKPESFAVTFYVEREATRAIVEAGLNDLSQELSASGFSAVTTNVWFNPDRVAAGATPARPATPAGTILDVMA